MYCSHFATTKSFLLFLLHLLTINALTSVSRRQAFLFAGGAPFIGVLTQPAEAVLRSKGCYQGEGEGCSEFAEGNELIRSLQERSLANKDRNEKVRYVDLLGCDGR